jgi:hypothetical protein
MWIIAKLNLPATPDFILFLLVALEEKKGKEVTPSIVQTFSWVLGISFLPLHPVHPVIQVWKFFEHPEPRLAFVSSFGRVSSPKVGWRAVCVLPQSPLHQATCWVQK